MASRLVNMGRGSLTNLPTTHYTVPPNHTAVLSEIVLSNNGSYAQFSAWVVPAGQALSHSFLIQNNIPLSQDEARYITLATVLLPGDRLILAAPAGDISFIASGLEVNDE